MKKFYRLPRVVVVISLLAFAGCAAQKTQSQQGDLNKQSHLVGTVWQLVEFQSMSDAVGTVRPTDAGSFIMRLNADGALFMQLGCNRARGKWSAQTPPSSASGVFRIENLIMTRALCPPPQLDQRFARDAQYVRSYLVENDRLFLSLFADGGIYEWQLIETQEGK